MYLFDLRAKLKLLNDQLFVSVDSQRAIRDTDAYVTGLWLNKSKRGEKEWGADQLDDKSARQYMEDDVSGAKPEFICGLPTNWIPEYDQFDLDNGRVIARGWRSIIKILHEKKLINIDRARRIFGCSSLLQSDYDRISYDVRLKWAKDERFPVKKKLVF